MNAKDVIIVKKKKIGERLENGYVHHLEQSSHPKKAKVREKRDCDGKKAWSSKAKKTYLCEVQNVQLSGRPPRMIREDEPAIVFTDKDARRLHHPHDDAIAITSAIANYTTRRMLIDNESSTDILYYLGFQQMRINNELLCLVSMPLIGFWGMKVLPVGIISLPIVVGFYPQ